MQEQSYWRQQTPTQPLFTEIEWTKPERRDQAGKLAIIGGSSAGFAGAAEGFNSAKQAGAGQIKILLPNILQKTIPPTINDAIFATSNLSGGFSREALSTLKTLGDWADGVLLAGDTGRSSETALLFDDFIRDYSGQLTLTRDAVDLLKNSAELLLERPNTLLVVSFAQIQKLFQNIYYPKMLTFNMNLNLLVETLHKFTVTYNCGIVAFHRETIVVAFDGQVVTQKWDQPMRIWRGQTAARAASYWLWNQNNLMQAVVGSLINY